MLNGTLPGCNKIEPRYSWDDIVQPEETSTQLREICRRVEQRRKVARDRRGGVTALFLGPSGIGKTMAAEVIATSLGMDLYRIDLAAAASKYIGETEKNLHRALARAEELDVILLFDEADALAGKRSDVKDSHDRYANVEINYLLQQIESHEGIVILTANSSSHLDEALVRRLAFTVRFPFPDEGIRLRMWQQVFPPETSLAPDVDRAQLAQRFELTGGSIQKVAVAAALLAAPTDGPITMDHLTQAVRREREKLGRPISDEELTV